MTHSEMFQDEIFLRRMKKEVRKFGRRFFGPDLVAREDENNHAIK
jgi:hypothetical protein